MANYTTRAQRRNTRMDKLFDTALHLQVRANVERFAAEWQRQEGYKPAPFQKAIAMQRLERGQSIREIIDALVTQRIR